MSKRTLLILLAIAAVTLAVGYRVNAAPAASDTVRIAALVGEMEQLGFAKVESLPSINVKPYTLPGASVDVMRVRLQESYEIAGIGNDTVDLTGWIAVRHGASRAANHQLPVSWGNSITDTEFVGLELQGQSGVFGPVRVSLDSARPAVGQVGNFDLSPSAARTLLVANKQQAEKPKPQPKPESSDTSASNCRAPVNVKVSMSQLGLEMKTKEPAVWFSQVTTIPPVGQVASVTVDPVAMMSAGRQVGTLVSGVVKFREVVRTVPLSTNHQVQVASLNR
ncbi:MAG TPA: DUF6073 family protein [Thermoanaerobaculia bacterium]|nr:DUF6073 family protein [Thermoanaerobaculia bacterium]